MTSESAQVIAVDNQLTPGIATDAPPPTDVARFHVDGVDFTLDVAALSPNAQRVYKMLAEGGSPYEPVMTRCLTKLLTKMDQPRFMDIGACVGYYTCYVAALLGNQSKPIYSIESNASFCEGIRRSCELNGLRNVKVCEAILSDVEEPAGVDRFSVVLGGVPGEDARMTVPLDRLCERESIPAPNIVKMDIHGCEGKALFGMTSFLRNVDYLLMELHGQDRLDEFSGGAKRSDVMNLLWGLGLSVYYVAGHATNRKQWNRGSIQTGGFAYRRVTPDNADCLLFDRLWHALFLVTKRDDVQQILGESSNDPFLCY